MQNHGDVLGFGVLGFGFGVEIAFEKGRFGFGNGVLVGDGLWLTISRHLHRLDGLNGLETTPYPLR